MGGQDKGRSGMHLDQVIALISRILSCLILTNRFRRKIINWISQCSESKYGKTGGMASKLRDEGNLKFSHCNTLESLKLYTQSVICSPEIGPELSLAFANRSAALYRLDKFETCLADIELAFKYKYAKNLAYKLHLRRGQCQVKLGNYIEAREALKVSS